MRQTRLIFAVLTILLGASGCGPGEAADGSGDPPPAPVLTIKGATTDPVSQLAFSPDDKVLISAGMKTISFWKASSGKLLRTMDTKANWPRFSPDGRIIADDDEQEKVLQLREAATGKVLLALKHPAHFAGVRRLSPDGKTLLAAFKKQDEDRLAVWDVTGKKRHSLDVESRTMPSCDFSPDGSWLATVELTSLRLWDLASGTDFWQASHGKGPLLWALFTPDSRLLVVSNWIDIVSVREVASSRVVSTWKADFPWDGPRKPRCSQSIERIALSSDGRTLATTSFRWEKGSRFKLSLQLWDIETGQELQQTKQEGKGTVLVRSLAFSHNGKRLASGLDDGTILVWDVAAIVNRKRPDPIALDHKELEALWMRLGAEDAGLAREALRELARAPGFPAFLAARLKDLPTRPAAASAERLAKRIADLDADDFVGRENASRELAALGVWAEAELRKRLREESTSPESRKRIGQILEGLKPKDRFTGPVLHWLRATEALERLGTAEARQVLQTIAAAWRPTGRAGQSCAGAPDRTRRIEY